MAGPGDKVTGDVTIKNNLSVQLVDAKVALAFSGNVFNDQSPASLNALYRLPNTTLYWDRLTSGKLERINPGDSVDLSFSFASLPAETISSIKNGTIKLDLIVEGRTIGTERAVSTKASKIVRIQPPVTVVPRIVYSVGSFENSGPIPPKNEETTTYTVIWTVTGSTNDLTNVEVRGTLPSYVQWIGPGGQKPGLTWNSEKSEIVWRIGDIPAGTAGRAAQEVEFQISFLPGFSQVRTTPDLVTNIRMKATDLFTRRDINVSGLKLSTELLTDPQYRLTDQKVQE